MLCPYVELLMEREGTMSVTARQMWIGLVALFVVALLLILFTVFWQHITGMNSLPLLGPYAPVGC